MPHIKMVRKGKGKGKDISAKLVNLPLKSNGNMNVMDVDLMTSRDFQSDTKAHIESMSRLLKDGVRVTTFRNAILSNANLFQGRIVLNLNCDMGIYALFAARAGAAKVYAVDNSNVVNYTQGIVQNNGYKHVIEVLKGKVTNLELPVKKVDIILSDWIGYAMLFQSTCADVIYARDKWLKKRGGIIFPDLAKLYMNAIEDEGHKSENVDWWRNVYGFNMTCLREFALKEVKFHPVRPDKILSECYVIKTLNLNTATVKDLEIRSKFEFAIKKGGLMDGIAFYFDVCFSKCCNSTVFSTDPQSPATNWFQTTCYFDQPLTVNKGLLYYGDVEFLATNSNNDFNDMIINFEMLHGKPAEVELEIEMSWRMKSPAFLPAGPDNNEEENRLRNLSKIGKKLDRNRDGLTKTIAQLSMTDECKDSAKPAADINKTYRINDVSKKRGKTRNAVLLSLESSSTDNAISDVAKKRGKTRNAVLLSLESSSTDNAIRDVSKKRGKTRNAKLLESSPTDNVINDISKKRGKTRNAKLLQSSPIDNDEKVPTTVKSTKATAPPLSIIIGDTVYYCRKQKRRSK